MSWLFALPILLAAPGASPPELQASFTFLDPGGFAIARAAGGDLAHDIYTIALDPGGGVFVSGPGYIRRLIDADADGVFEAAKDYFRGPANGCQGMVFHGRSLFAAGGEGLLRFDDEDGDAVADGPPELLLPLAGGEHGAHALRIGPDGMLYFLGGNHCGLTSSRLSPDSPLREFYAGVFCRMDLAAASIEVLVDGMRNAYDFDFTPSGDVFGWDSDSERNEGLDWYRPCRLYHFTPGADCGWRGMGTGETPRGSAAAIDPAAEAGRGSPTGIACYRHTAFPARYRGSLFALDWTFGRVYRFGLVERGATFGAEPEIFLAASGAASFAPSDVVVDQDGSLLITSGGRGIAGNVYRVRATSQPEPAPPGDEAAGPGPPWTPRAQAARRLGHEGSVAGLAPLLVDPHLHVRRAAAESVARRHRDPGAADLLPGVLALAACGDARLDQAAAAALARFEPARWPPGRSPAERLLLGHAHVMRAAPGTLPAAALEAALGVIEEAAGSPAAPDGASELVPRALKLAGSAFERLKTGEDPDYHVFDPEWERVDLTAHTAVVERARRAARAALARGGEPRLVSARLLARLRDPAPESAELIAGLLTPESAPSRDMLAFWWLSQLASDWDGALEDRIAAAALAIPDKVRRQQVGRDDRWSLYQTAIWERLGARHPDLCRRIAGAGGFGEPEHLELLGAAAPETLERAAEALLARIASSGGATSRSLEFLSGRLRGDGALARLRPILRQALADPALARAALEGLARFPEAQDREHFLAALDDRDPALVRPALAGLGAMPAPPAIEDEVTALLAWGLGAGRVLRDGDAAPVAARLAKVTGTPCPARDGERDAAATRLACWLDWLRARHPARASELDELLRALPRGDEAAAELVVSAPWAAGDSVKGRGVFQARGCGACHHLGGVGQRVGPDLAGVSRRLGLKELLVELIDPSRVVPERYFFDEYTLASGERIEGMEIYTSRSAIRIVARDGRDLRFAAADVLSVRRQSRSLMPDGLLSGLTPAEVADLVAYIRSF